MVLIKEKDQIEIVNKNIIYYGINTTLQKHELLKVIFELMYKNYICFKLWVNDPSKTIFEYIVHTKEFHTLDIRKSSSIDRSKCFERIYNLSKKIIPNFDSFLKDIKKESNTIYNERKILPEISLNENKLLNLCLVIPELGFIENNKKAEFLQKRLGYSCLRRGYYWYSFLQAICLTV